MPIRDRVKELRRVPASELRANPKNWRTHPLAQQAALRGILAEIGFADALIARETPDGLVLIDGHLRTEVMGNAEVPVLILDVTEEEADKLLVTLDPLAAMATHDQEALLSLLESVKFQDSAVNDLLEALANDNYQFLTPLLKLHELKPDPGPQFDRAAELQAEWGTARGQVWEVGKHRLMCGDATSAEDVGELVGTGAPTLLVTDPPYGVAFDPAWRDRAGINTMGKAEPGYGEDARWDWSEAYALVPTLTVCLCMACRNPYSCHRRQFSLSRV